MVMCVEDLVGWLAGIWFQFSVCQLMPGDVNRNTHAVALNLKVHLYSSGKHPWLRDHCVYHCSLPACGAELGRKSIVRIAR